MIYKHNIFLEFFPSVDLSRNLQGGDQFSDCGNEEKEKWYI